MSQKVYFVGTHAEVAHHAAPLAAEFAHEIALPKDVLERAQPGDLAIFHSEHFDRFRECIHKLKKRQIATLYMIDGILEWRNAWENRSDEVACPWTMRPVLSDKAACIGFSQISILNSWGNSAKTELVGIPRFDRLRTLETPPANSDPDRARILLMSAKCPGFTPEQIAKTYEGFSQLKSWFEQNPVVGGREIELSWRLTGDLAKQLNVDSSCSDLTGGELVDAIGSVDAVITTPSTAMLEAMLLQRPVAILDYNDSPQMVSAPWTITSDRQIAGTVAQLLDVPPTKQHYQQTALDITLAPTANATGRFSALVRRMLSCAATAKSDDLNFPPNLLGDLPEETQMEFDHAQLYPTYPEFQDTDLVELQTSLAHSRREVDHLHREMDQLKSELTQAHEIFEQIHRHPVAGPVIRIRQKFISWIGRFRSHPQGIDTPTPLPSSQTSSKSTVTF